MKRITVLCLLLAGLGLTSCSRDEAAKKEEPKAVAPVGAADVSPQLLALLPAKNEVPGWAQSQQPRSFNPGNLWEFIDGAADGYLTYGFQEVVTADYTQEGTGYQTVLDIYQMKDPLNAFGKYSEERNPEYQFLKVGNEGYSGGTSLNFWSGPYYVKITVFDDKEAIKQEMAKLANAVAGKITAPAAEPAEVSFFPKANQLPHTIAYIPKDVLAQSYFTNGFQAMYKAGDKEYKMILVSLDDPAGARNALGLYRQFLSKGGKDVKDLKAPGDGGFSGQDSFYGNMAAIRAGKNIIVALGVPSEDAGIKAIKEMLGNIKY
jgi:hypothetical protein